MYDSEDEKCNLELLRNPKQKGFLDEIQSAHIFLAKDQIDDYFDIVLSHFRKEQFDVECGHAVLRSLCWVLSTDAFLNIFLDPQNEYPLMLPFSQDEYIDDVFDVLYIIVTRKPEAFDEQLIEQFDSKVQNRGYKSLAILSIYSQHFNDITDPYPMLDVLFSNFKEFSKIDLAKDYAGLLAILVRSYPEFRRDKGMKSWAAVRKLLDVITIPDDLSDKNSNILDIISSIYSSLSEMASCLRFSFSEKNSKSKDKSSIFNFGHVVEHFKYESLHESIISFLLIVPIEYEQLKDRMFLKMLLEDAQTDSKATYVLIRLAEDRIIAPILIEKLPFWMETKNPTLQNTLQLFLVVFQHKDLWTIISEKPEFIKFLLHIIKCKDDPESYINIVCKIIRRIRPSNEIMDEFSSNGVISSFMDVVQKINTPNIITSGLLLLDLVSRTQFRKELVQNCDWISNVIKDYEGNEHEYIFNDAVNVATVLAKHRKCSRKFSDLRMLDYFDELVQHKKYKKIAEKFINTVERNLDK